MREWRLIDSAPKDGTRIEVKHELSLYGSLRFPATAVWGGDDAWVCSEMFIDPNTMAIYRQPTHWRPKPNNTGGDNG